MGCSEVYIKAFSKGIPFTIKEVKASCIGQLVKTSGIITRVSEVKPLMQVAVYTFEECGFEIYQADMYKILKLLQYIIYVFYNFSHHQTNKKGREAIFLRIPVESLRFSDELALCRAPTASRRSIKILL
ncbi:hypothetical protein AAC387_Pa06g1639 [Persea americana]